jgi:cytochrome c peroxidase
MKLILPCVAVATAIAGLCYADPTEIDSTIDQKAFAFNVSQMTVKRGSSVRFTNSDTVMHNVIVIGADHTVDSGSQKPGQTVRVFFPDTGEFKVICAIHPRMKVHVSVD